MGRLARYGLLIIASLGLISVWGLVNAPRTEAKTVTPGVCRAVLIFDRSGSVGNAGIETMRSQVKRLFEPTGLYRSTIELAFWSFADGGSGAYDYNSPGYGFVSSRGMNSGFNSALSSLAVTRWQATNYEMGFGYNGDVRNASVAGIADKADIIVFMTDGKPNFPTTLFGQGDGNWYSVSMGRRAAVHHLDAGRIVLGGLVGTAVDKPTLAKVINGDANNYAHLFQISGNYSDLSEQIKQQVGTQCDLLNQPCPYNPDISATDPECKSPDRSPYSLIPSVTTDNTVISGTDSASFKYTIENTSKSTPSDATDWSIKRMVVERGQSIDGLLYDTTQQYRDDYSCDKLLELINDKGTCEDAGSHGSRTFGVGMTTLSASEVGLTSSTTIDDSWQVGTKLCYVLTVAKPTEKEQPTHRYSKASCVIIGKRPTFQVHGSDVTVGRRFAGDAPNSALTNIRGSVTMKTGSVNKTFGSWAEYGIFAPGVVSGVASSAGLEGGYEGMVGANQELWSTLTFANTGGEYGSYTHAAGMGAMTDMANYFVQGRAVVGDLSGTSEVSFKGNVTNGLYQKQNGSITLHESSLEKGKAVFLYVPQGTVTIDGNSTYSNGPYSSIDEIPQLIIIAQNIVIKDTVTRVDAWLLAQDDKNRGGMIATCDKEPPLTAEQCNAPLIVNGPVAAKQLLLRRTGGSGTGQASGDPAEVINLRADAYLWGYNEGRSAVRAETTSTIELPPQF